MAPDEGSSAANNKGAQPVFVVLALNAAIIFEPVTGQNLIAVTKS